MKTLRIIFAASLLALALAQPVLAASIPATLSYQGTMVDKSGQPITDTKSIVFNLYTVATEGTAFWTETQTVNITSGKFTAQLGAVVANPLNLATFGGDTWLGLTISGEPEMTPREKMTSVPYAFNGVPKGVITMWSGSIATIPQGWAICDGTNGTPNLKDRFIVGAGSSYAVGATGGSAQVALTSLSQIPSHNHGGGNHNHSVNLVYILKNAGWPEGPAYMDGYWGFPTTPMPYSNQIINSEGGGESHENRPPYYALAYIVKL